MNDPRHSARLLADVLGEGASAEFRQGLLNETLRLARCRRRFRQARVAATVLAVLAVSGLLIRHLSPPDRVPADAPAKPYLLVRTQPLPPAAWVQTKPFSAASLVASLAPRHVVLTANSRRPVHELNDDELLALVPKPAALVRCGPHCAQLVFVNQADRDELLRN